MRIAPDTWSAIRADYERYNVSYVLLSRKHGASVTSISRHRWRENWRKGKRQPPALYAMPRKNVDAVSSRSAMPLVELRTSPPCDYMELLRREDQRRAELREAREMARLCLISIQKRLEQNDLTQENLIDLAYTLRSITETITMIETALAGGLVHVK